MASTIQVVLNEDVKKLGFRGETVNVRRGYFRNFLRPRGLADFASKARLKVAGSRMEKLVMRKEQVKAQAQEVLDKLTGLKVKIAGKMTEAGKLYGSITEDQVLKALTDAAKVELEKSNLRMDHFKDLGTHKVVVHLGEGLEAEVAVEVVAEK